MKTTLCIAALIAAAASGCAADRPVSPGVVKHVGGATFVCDGRSCRLVADETAGEQVEQDAVGSMTYTISKRRCSKAPWKPVEPQP